MATTERQRRELAAFLRSRRERRDPVDFGLVPGRRRTPGLRREEVATLASVSITWYSWLEQARDIRVSADVLASLARALHLDPAETEHLYQLAGHVPPGAVAEPVPEVAAQHRLLLANLEPSPAFLSNRRFDVLAWNRAHTVLYGDFARLAPADRNMLWLLFTDPAQRALAVDWPAAAAYGVGLFRSQAGELLSSPEFVALVERLLAASPEFRELWERRDLSSFVPASQEWNHPLLGRVAFEYVKMYAADEDRTLVAHLVRPGSELATRLAELIAADSAVEKPGS
ncbi:helix-turn-helix domain-containing protein [Solihabitans fulvus]|uniref:Helix-turn-helix domain-containing protein n=1 Tax=Solihabitans fulvus TaxID=1892852 RepID=A0A5B2XGA5_9PSEU|nr:helix-turn-helix transcriptional regulator [Solihabitans fulvus]KAA2261921.1 helix-turn-helix domain-containing protein [Solihabitans fulvus]